MFCKYVENAVVPGSLCECIPYKVTMQVIDGMEQEIKILDPDYLPIEIPQKTSDAQEISCKLENGKVICEWLGSPDPMERLATSEEIKSFHRELEQSPIIVFGYLLDCDERSELRMRDALSTWDARPVQSGMFEDLNGVRVIYWTLGNNNVIPINKNQLQSFFDEMLIQRAIRGANLYRRYRELKSSGCTLRELNDPSTWE